MIYLTHRNIEKIGVDWPALVGVIEDSLKAIGAEDFSQPIKPYLRYKELRNRIIAMPAYVGANFNLAGIKWIASFPGNLELGIPRAHSVTVLNDADTGKPLCVINTTLVSEIRTAAVSGLMIREYLSRFSEDEDVTVGITGLGPIGRIHINLVLALLGSRLSKLLLYDIRPVGDIVSGDRSGTTEIRICNSWEEAYRTADIFIACTVSQHRYIDKEPKRGSLQLNVSLRDYVPQYRQYVDMIVADSWEEVCRENTDIELMNKIAGLRREEVHLLKDVLLSNMIRNASRDAVIMFNPMGMAVFDIAIAGYYYNEARRMQIGYIAE